MENKTYSETRRKLLLQLRDAVNSQEEFDYINAELARPAGRMAEVPYGPSAH